MPNRIAEKKRAPRNRTLVLDDSDRARLRPRLIQKLGAAPEELINATVFGDFSDFAQHVTKPFVDLLVLDPPYNLNKAFNGLRFKKKKVADYTEWLDGIVSTLIPLLRPHATVYICGDWHTSASIFEVASRYFVVRNRITWEREKGRGAKTNWKNSSEDIWFCTLDDEFTFNVVSVKLRRKVIAPYTNADGSPKDWNNSVDGKFRDTHPSNLWTDITIPFWSMPENTDHPTQKSEKLLARLILASSNKGNLVLDPFVGSGTTSVVAKKLERNYLGIEIDEEFCLLTERRLELAETNRLIQGYDENVFWERNTLAERQKLAGSSSKNGEDKRTNGDNSSDQPAFEF
jgi:site-specific DNA-methyltransferase (adenine-specific)